MASTFGHHSLVLLFPVSFLTFHLILLFILKLFRCVKWYILEKHWYAVPIFQGVITLFVLINFSMATFMDPGVS